MTVCYFETLQFQSILVSQVFLAYARPQIFSDDSITFSLVRIENGQIWAILV